jgi:2-C-methyl-D-erythritol 2,4-cyclodiphosphate synthase
MNCPFRVGMGYDVHAFAPGRRLVLGGVEIPSDLGLLGHSDADAALHALCDAILGAAGLRDIGFYYSNRDARWKDVDSRVLLRDVREKAAERGWQIGNVDLTIIAERPRLSPHVEAMRAAIAEDLRITIDDVAIKATTNEGMGFVGRSEGIAATAVALLWREGS